MTIQIKNPHQLRACLLAGAIGDAMASPFENTDIFREIQQKDVFDLFPSLTPIPRRKPWQITDDTQLTLATCEAIIEKTSIDPQTIAQKFAAYYKQRRLSGLGASTLKALQALEIGAHWSQAGRKGEFAAGNGAAMRIAPLAFAMENLDRKLLEDVCRITHDNSEAYTGALCILLAIQSVIGGKWTGNENLFELLISQLPDTQIRDRLIAINHLPEKTSIKTVAEQFGCSAYVVESVPLAIFAASKVQELSLKGMFESLIEIGGDTDTNCSMAGQIAGALIGIENIPLDLILQLQGLEEYEWIDKIINDFTKFLRG